MLDAEHGPRSAPAAVQPGDLERATPIRAGNRLWDSNRQHDRLSVWRLKHSSGGNSTNRPGRSEFGHRRLIEILSARGAKRLYPWPRSEPSGSLAHHSELQTG